MYKKIQFWEFEHDFDQCRPDNFSSEGLRILWDWFEELENNDIEEMELDVIAICCEFSEMELDEYLDQFDAWNDDIDQDSTDQEKQNVIEEHANWETCFVAFTNSGTVVFRDF